MDTSASSDPMLCGSRACNARLAATTTGAGAPTDTTAAAAPARCGCLNPAGLEVTMRRPAPGSIVHRNTTCWSGSPMASRRRRGAAMATSASAASDHLSSDHLGQSATARPRSRRTPAAASSKKPAPEKSTRSATRWSHRCTSPGAPVSQHSSDGLRRRRRPHRCPLHLRAPASAALLPRSRWYSHYTRAPPPVVLSAKYNRRTSSRSPN